MLFSFNHLLKVSSSISIIWKMPSPMTGGLDDEDGTSARTFTTVPPPLQGCWAWALPWSIHPSSGRSSSLETSLQRLKGKVNAEKMLWATNCYIGQRHGCSTTFHPTGTKKHLSEKKIFNSPTHFRQHRCDRKFQTEIWARRLFMLKTMSARRVGRR